MKMLLNPINVSKNSQLKILSLLILFALNIWSLFMYKNLFGNSSTYDMIYFKEKNPKLYLYVCLRPNNSYTYLRNKKYIRARHIIDSPDYTVSWFSIPLPSLLSVSVYPSSTVPRKVSFRRCSRTQREPPRPPRSRSFYFYGRLRSFFTSHSVPLSLSRTHPVCSTATRRGSPSRGFATSRRSKFRSTEGRGAETSYRRRLVAGNLAENVHLGAFRERSKAAYERTMS